MSTLANAMDVLKLIVRLRRDITVTDLVTALGYPKSSASRTLSQMAAHGFLERDAVTKAYRPGLLVVEAGHQFRVGGSVLPLLEEALEQLVGATGFTGYLGVLRGAEILVVQMRAGAQPLQVYTPPGTSGPAAFTSMGRALLARLSDAEVLALVGRKFDRPPGSAPKTPRELLDRLAQTRRDGWNESRGESLAEVYGIASSVRDPSTGEAYGIGLAIPPGEGIDALFERCVVRVRDAASGVGRRIGDPYWLQMGG
ncbi:MAG: IclR family transcriptional regulator [Roseateles sp.]|uniref:IclR family transcriptional regulator n=1 Tax=Roseateles sp. TaxID=1971397 RepID=UPI0039E8A81E